MKDMPFRKGVRLEFKVNDCWIGWFWKRNGPQLDVWICVVPMVPLHIRWFFAQKFPPPIEMSEEEYGAFRRSIERPDPTRCRYERLL